MNRQIILVTGPARSGKSEWAETLAVRSHKSVIYVATALLDSNDTEWQARIELHRNRRPASWNTLDVPVDLAGTIELANESSCLLIDSLGTWLANILALDEAAWRQTLQDLLSSLQKSRGDVIFVAEETGWGVIPAYPLGRLFRDRLGTAIRELGAIANPVYLVAGGHVLNLSALGFPLPGNINRQSNI
ncbi:bifunctional adenosylcobinamide kinase/adenosylcobinamide-phosphate guanylyltransferase [Kamptonema sp. UHCC 0994]|uniref:bifunctional adenosylcobinamide kinase/adenosylcobinamide-phosphate guanylyltransferase n=1 Tax=Kamptonema sp. UHCC 0994 TaxID=3031329 RepID=UPI0023B92966|nr:bifunctional adenosylcobinamide kinase/adenosylcobinamide-phosphate guanylyltransferase [Kamptonema sp. UHCC 0994]MDF0554575.1 bifunctional adenosylcobinamide kinase/adenosylcobinamide-phosphate guanylyltransferase [Kamptonema sp. UHCC 0994]